MSLPPPQSPFEFFEHCFAKAKSLKILQVDAVALVTATKSAKPSGRMVLLKGINPERGFRFFTNYDSRKSAELMENPQAQLLFYWAELGRQIRIEGKVERTSREDSDAYFASRGQGSRIGAIASFQSRPLGSAEELRARVEKITKDLEGREVLRPENWGGFELVAERFEFWEDRADRLHERVTYERDTQGNWITGRLWP